MPIELPHVGEHILASMINEMRTDFVEKRFKPIQQDWDLNFIATAPQIAFPEASLKEPNGKAFDGMSQIDVLVLISSNKGIAIELKLGHTGLGVKQLENWLDSYSTNSHKGKRHGGSMLAILRQNSLGHLKLEANANKTEIEVIQNFWMIISHKQTVRKWEPILQGKAPSAQLLSIQDLVEDYGGAAKFNALVQNCGLIPSNPYQEWVRA